MKETFKFEKAFGPVASFSGHVILTVGIIATYFSIAGLILVLFGSFVGLTYSSTTIDYSQRKVKFSNCLFGFIKTGKWIDINNDMRIGINKSSTIYRTYSKSTRILDITAKHLMIYLYDDRGNPIIPLKMVTEDDNAEKELEDLKNKLGLPSY